MVTPPEILSFSPLTEEINSSLFTKPIVSFFDDAKQNNNDGPQDLPMVAVRSIIRHKSK